MTSLQNNSHRLIFLLVGVLLSSGAYAMAGLFGSYILFSDVNGTIYIDSKPCIGARLEQRVRSPYGEDQAQSTETNADGRFSFPELTEKKSLFSFLPSEFAASQEIKIYYEGKEYLAWAHSKRSAERNAESDGKPLNLICELNKSPDEADKYSGICKIVN